MGKIFKNLGFVGLCVLGKISSLECYYPPHLLLRNPPSVQSSCISLLRAMDSDNLSIGMKISQEEIMFEVKRLAKSESTRNFLHKNLPFSFLSIEKLFHSCHKALPIKNIRQKFYKDTSPMIHGENDTMAERRNYIPKLRKYKKVLKNTTKFFMETPEVFEENIHQGLKCVFHLDDVFQDSNFQPFFYDIVNTPKNPESNSYILREINFLIQELSVWILELEIFYRSVVDIQVDDECRELPLWENYLHKNYIMGKLKKNETFISFYESTKKTLPHRIFFSPNTNAHNSLIDIYNDINVQFPAFEAMLQIVSGNLLNLEINDITETRIVNFSDILINTEKKINIFKTTIILLLMKEAIVLNIDFPKKKVTVNTFFRHILKNRAMILAHNEFSSGKKKVY